MEWRHLPLMQSSDVVSSIVIKLNILAVGLITNSSILMLLLMNVWKNILKESDLSKSVSVLLVANIREITQQR